VIYSALKTFAVRVQQEKLLIDSSISLSWAYSRKYTCGGCYLLTSEQICLTGSGSRSYDTVLKLGPYCL
jgi:hypothetical protein